MIGFSFTTVQRVQRLRFEVIDIAAPTTSPPFFVVVSCRSTSEPASVSSDSFSGFDLLATEGGSLWVLAKDVTGLQWVALATSSSTVVRSYNTLSFTSHTHTHRKLQSKLATSCVRLSLTQDMTQICILLSYHSRANSYVHVLRIRARMLVI